MAENEENKTRPNWARYVRKLGSGVKGWAYRVPGGHGVGLQGPRGSTWRFG